MDQEKLFENANNYCELSNIQLLKNSSLGHGTDGSVWETGNRTALKAFYRKENYDNELECYQRLKNNEILEINGISVPHLEGYNDQLMVIEMTYVRPPYILDFGKVYIDRPAPYHDDEMIIEGMNQRIQADFNQKSNVVHGLLYQLRQLGIYYVDPRPANICLDELE